MNTSTSLWHISTLKLALAFVGLALFAFLIWFIASTFTIGSHWSEIFRPATLFLVSGHSPYANPRFFNPPWALIPLIPFALMPPAIGNAFICILTMIAFGYVAYRMGAKPIVIILFLLLPQTLYNLVQVNIDWLVALGFILPPQIGLFFVLIKPQLGAPLAIFWFVEALRRGGVREVARVFGPVSVAFLLSFLIFGLYLQRASFMADISGFNFWPASIPIGLALLVSSIRSRKPGLSIACAPLLTPYIQPYSLPIAILGLLPDQVLTFIMMGSLYIMLINPRYWYIFERLFHLIRFAA